MYLPCINTHTHTQIPFQSSVIFLALFFSVSPSQPLLPFLYWHILLVSVESLMLHHNPSLIFSFFQTQIIQPTFIDPKRKVLVFGHQPTWFK